MLTENQKAEKENGKTEIDLELPSIIEENPAKSLSELEQDYNELIQIHYNNKRDDC